MSENPKTVEVTVKFADGSKIKYPKDTGNMPVAIFLGDSGKALLGELYEGWWANREMEKSELEKRFGKKRADALSPTGDAVILGPNSINKLWNTPGDDGLLMGTLSKDPDCLPG